MEKSPALPDDFAERFAEILADCVAREIVARSVKVIHNKKIEKQKGSSINKKNA